MKFINVNTQCFKNNFLLGQNGALSLISSIDSTQENDKYIIGAFSIITFISIRGTINKNDKDNPLDTNKTLSFRIRFTKLDEDSEKQLSYDLKDFDIDLKKEKIHKACFDYVERIEVLNINKITLEQKGAYVIKIMVKEKDKEKYEIQTLHPLYVN